MFKLVYLKLRNVYNRISHFYSRLVCEHPYAIVLLYVVLSMSLGAGLALVRFVKDAEPTTYNKHGDSLRDAHELRSLFKEEQHGRFFAHQIADIGHYVEIIITAKRARNTSTDLLKSEFNLLNETILSEYDDLFDRIINLQIEYNYDSQESEFVITKNQSELMNDHTTTTTTTTTTSIAQKNNDYEDKSKAKRPKTNNTYIYIRDLCARRLHKCSIEGGILRAELFKRKLLANEIFYDSNDPKTLYQDTTLMDGASMSYLFGEMKRSNCSNLPRSSKQRCFVYHAGAIRNRFDLLYQTKAERLLAVAFMRSFAEMMHQLELNNTYNHLNVSFHASQTLQSEIEKYSMADLKYLVGLFVTFWLLFFLTMWLDLGSFWLKLERTLKFHFNKRAGGRFGLFGHEGYCTKMSVLKSIFYYNPFWIYNAGYLVFVTFVQFVITLVDTVGFMSYIGVQTNPLFYTIVFVLMSK
jgi:hypothetical protein